MGKILIVAGFAVFLYAGYHAMLYREQVRMNHQEFDGLPLWLLWCLVVATVLVYLGGMLASGPLKRISVADAPQLYERCPMVRDFVTFDNRGDILGMLMMKEKAPKAG